MKTRNPRSRRVIQPRQRPIHQESGGVEAYRRQPRGDRRFTQAGFIVVVATNQSGVGRGLFDMATLNAMHDKMHKAVNQLGGRIDAVFFCPHARMRAATAASRGRGCFEIAERFKRRARGCAGDRRLPARPSGRERGRRAAGSGAYRERQADAQGAAFPRAPRFMRTWRCSHGARCMNFLRASSITSCWSSSSCLLGAGDVRSAAAAHPALEDHRRLAAPRRLAGIHVLGIRYEVLGRENIPPNRGDPVQAFVRLGDAGVFGIFPPMCM